MIENERYCVYIISRHSPDDIQIRGNCTAGSPPSVDGSLLAREFWTVMQCWSVLPSVRPVVAALIDDRWP
jgi:hypothetical protein